MAENTVTRADLSEAVYHRRAYRGMNPQFCRVRFLSEIADTLTRGETVKISSFGSFSVRQKAN